ncbi:MAG: metallophosphoesterase [Bacteroidales bacterium]|jgi:Icc-related predicted phosphoesterase|nr:metallophosphoesterase [Bacteroidales bacterium]
MLCFFVSDLHGKTDRYQKLFSLIRNEKPNAVFIGGDLFPHNNNKPNEFNFKDTDDFIDDIIVSGFRDLKKQLLDQYPEVFIILGNDDPKIEEQRIINAELSGIWKYMHNKRTTWQGFDIFGYSNIPPSPFLLKDWERYDVSRYVDPGCIHPTEGKRTTNDNTDIEYATIQKDIEELTKGFLPEKSIFLFHSPPYQTNLDRAALDGKTFDHVPLDVNVGSIAIRRFIENKQPLLTLHGHIHESSEITGHWSDKIGNTILFSAAYNKPELAVVKFDPEDLGQAERIVI